MVYIAKLLTTGLVPKIIFSMTGPTGEGHEFFGQKTKEGPLLLKIFNEAPPLNFD